MEQLLYFFFQQDGQLNETFDLSWYDQSRVYIRLSAVLSGVVVLGFLPFDFVLLEKDAAFFLVLTRLLFLLPACFFIFFMTYRNYSCYQVYSATAVSYTIAGIGFNISGAMTSETASLYILVAQLQVITFVSVLTRLPWRLALLSATTTWLGFASVSLIAWDLPLPQLIPLLTGTIAIVTILAIGTIFRDRQGITLFKAEQALRTAQEQKINWSNTFTRFLKHELSNQIAGISLSLQMLERTAKLDSNTYIQRGQKSVMELQELLNRAVEAVTIDEIVADATREELSLDSLIDELLFEYNLAISDSRAVIQFSSPKDSALPTIWGNPMQLKQLLRNLVDNGIRHARNDSVVEIATPEPGIITVKNSGEPLPENPEKLFELWHSGGGNSGLFGLGLYLARKIALAHGGKLTAYNPENDQGAIFCLQLPCK